MDTTLTTTDSLGAEIVTELIRAETFAQLPLGKGALIDVLIELFESRGIDLTDDEHIFAASVWSSAFIEWCSAPDDCKPKE